MPLGSAWGEIREGVDYLNTYYPNHVDCIITNPPYGERIQKTDLNDFYRMIGDVLKKKFAGYTAWLITSDFGALKSVGLRTSRKITLYNGPLECRFVQYQMYRGSRKGGEVSDE